MPQSFPPMRLKVSDLACARGGRTVFRGLSFDLDPGMGLLVEGPNGAGKSSLLRLIAGLLRPAQGSIALEGPGGDAEIGQFCHYVGHLNGIKRTLDVAENVRFWIDFLEGEADAGSILQRVGLDGLSGIPAGLLSAGQSRRLALARLMAAQRPLWLLDEPSVSLDAAGQALLGELIESHLAMGGLVVAATHMPLGGGFARTLSLRGGPL